MTIIPKHHNNYKKSKRNERNIFKKKQTFLCFFFCIFCFFSLEHFLFEQYFDLILFHLTFVSKFLILSLLFFFDFSVLEEGRREIFSIFFDFGDFFYFCFDILSFVLGERERFFFLICFYVFLTTFGPDRLLAPFFGQTVLCPNLNPGGFGAAWASHDSPGTPNVHFVFPTFNHTTKIQRNDTQERKKEKIVAGEGKKREISRLPPFGGPPRDPPLLDRPKFRPFFHLPPHCRSFSHSGSLLVDFWWCLKRRCQLCTFGVTGKPGGFCKMSRTILQLIDLPPHKTSEKVNDQLLQILLVSKKKKKPRTQPKFHVTTPPSGPTPLGPHCFWVVVCAAPDSAACCCFSCCLCSCCGLLPPLFVLLLVIVAAFGPPQVQCLTFQNVNNNFFN